MLLNPRHYNSVGVHAGPLNGANATEKAQEAVGGRSEDEPSPSAGRIASWGVSEAQSLHLKLRTVIPT